MTTQNDSTHTMTNGEFLTGMLCGAAVGAVCGVLFTPRAGADVRRQISDSAGRLRERAAEGYQGASDNVSHMISRGREALERGREAFRRTRESANASEPRALTQTSDVYSTGSMSRF